MIYAVTGTPGSGKSWYAVRRICQALIDGKPVATNVPLRPGWAHELARRNPRHRLTRGGVDRAAAKYERLLLQLDPRHPDDLMKVRLNGSGEGRGIAVLDEAHEWLNSRMWADGDRKEFVAWFSTHRHYGWDVYLLTQYLDSIDKQVRDRVEWHISVRNLRNARVAGVRIFPFSLFLAIHLWAGGPQATRHVGRRETYVLDRRRQLYDTHGLAFEGSAPDDAIWLPREAEQRPAAGATRVSVPPPAANDDDARHIARGRAAGDR